MNVQCRIRRFVGKLSKAMNELLLQVVGQVVLRAEEDDAALRYCWK
jgi:hypothetical protein